MTRATLTPAIKKRITADWQRQFPHLAVAKPMWLMRRNGPMVTGICLDRTNANDAYMPVFHVHNLLWPWPAVTLDLAQFAPDLRQPRVKCQIRVDRHEVMFESAVESLKKDAPDIMVTDTRLSRVLEMYNEYIELRRHPAISRYPVNLFRDVILLTFWAGYRDHAMGLLSSATAVIESWQHQQIDLKAWAQTLRAALSPERLESTLEAQLREHKLMALPEYELAIDGLPERSVVDVYLASLRTSDMPL